MKSYFGNYLFLVRFAILLILFGTFAAFFGIPSIYLYLENKTIFLETEREHDFSDFPVITVYKTDSSVSYVLPSCSLLHNNSADFFACMTENTLDLNQTILEMRQNYYYGDNVSVDMGKWVTGYSIWYIGRYYSLKGKYNLSNEDYLRVTFPKNGSYVIDLYDGKFFYERTEQFEDFKRVQIPLKRGGMTTLKLGIEEINLLPDVSDCIDDEDYSFLQCTKDWINRQIGCRHFWDSISSQTLPICNSIKEYQELEKINEKFITMSRAKIEKQTNCKRNCRFKNYYSVYKIEVPNDEEMSDIQETLLNMNLASSTLTVKTQTLVFPLRSLVADIGGTMGLFLGFSFVMIWDGIEHLIKLLKKLYDN